MISKIIKINLIVTLLIAISNNRAFSKDSEVIQPSSKFSKNQLVKKNSDEIKKTNPTNKSEPINYFKGLSASIALEKARGFSQENVYHNNKKISELNWKFREVKMARLNISFDIDKFFKINTSYATSFDNSSKSYMTDYDWLGSPGGDDGNKNHNDWTHYSYSTTKTAIQEFDINSSVNFLKYFDFAVGYREHRFDFSDSLQNINYSCTQVSFNNNQCAPIAFRNNIQNYNGINVIDYYQRFRIPYIGANFSYALLDNKLKFNIYSAFSNFVNAYSRDHHIARGFEVISEFNNGKYYNFGSNISYLIYKNLSLNLGFDYFEIPEIRGDGYYNYYNDNNRFVNLNGAGISNKTQRASLGLKYDF